MFTDMVGYTALGQRDESLSLTLLEEYRRLLRPVFQRHKGIEVKTFGDAFLVEFSSALEAVRCAYDIQRTIRDFSISLPPDQRIQLRIGVHLGDVVESRGDISGDAVNVASRVELLAENGGVCLTRQVFDHVQNKFELPLKNLGPKNLKNVSMPIEVFKMVMPWDENSVITSQLDMRRIAVLPFANMSPDPNDQYFADGMTEELITSLSALKDLTVIARTSVMRYKNVAKPMSEIGKELNTGTLVEGSVRKAGNRVRITVQLIDAGKEGHLWAQNYDRQMDDIFAIQSEIAEKVVNALEIKLVDSEKRRLEARRTDNVEAYNLYLKGRFYWNERNLEAIRKAVEYFNAAVQKDPGFALGYAGLADCYFILHINLLEKVEGGFQKAKEYASKALSINDDLAEAHTTLAFIHLNGEYDFRGAEAEFKHAISLNPNYATAHQWYAHLLNHLGRKTEAMAEVRKALEIDPLSSIINHNVGDALYYKGDFQAAIDQYEKVLEISPQFYFAYLGMAKPLCRLGKFEEALRAVNEYSKKANPTHAKTARAYVLAYTDKEKAKNLIGEVRREDTEGVVPSYVLALASFALGDVETGFALLEQSFERHEPDILIMKVDYELDGVRSDPRYLSLLNKLGLG